MDLPGCVGGEATRDDLGLGPHHGRLGLVCPRNQWRPGCARPDALQIGAKRGRPQDCGMRYPLGQRLSLVAVGRRTGSMCGLLVALGTAFEESVGLIAR